MSVRWRYKCVNCEKEPVLRRRKNRRKSDGKGRDEEVSARVLIDFVPDQTESGARSS